MNGLVTFYQVRLGTSRLKCNILLITENITFMTKEEIIKKFPFSVDNHLYGKTGECTLCAYFDFCDKMLPGFIRPGKCGGPFMRNNL
jgi:hypothetical protein